MAAAAVLVGCTETRTYSLSVRNDLDRPVTVCLTKTFGPEEPDWVSPEQAAGPAHPASDERPPGVVLRPGKSRSLRDVSGEFYRDRGYAVLRVYAGTPTLTRMNAIGRGTLDRADYQLRPGANDLAIVQADDGRMRVEPAGPATRPE